MATQIVQRAGETADLGAFTVPTQSLRELVPAEFTKNGVVLADSKSKIAVMEPQADGTHKPVVYTVGLYIGREPMNDHEAAEVQKAIDAYNGRTKERDAKLASEKEAQRKAVDAAFKMGKDVGTETIAAASQLANTIASLQAHGVKVG